MEGVGTVAIEIAIHETFDRVVVMNLARRPDRLERFRDSIVDWPFKKPQVFEAVDGLAIGAPAGWDKGPGAWGCLLSHLRIVSQAITDGVLSLLVLEDDAFPVENFGSLASEFLHKVPQDWDCLMLGAHHLAKPKPLAPGVVRCVLSNRAHAYAVRGRFKNVLKQSWEGTVNDHCDIVLASLMSYFNVYAPDPPLMGQDGGKSDISGRIEQRRFVPVLPRDIRFLAQPLLESSRLSGR